MQSEISVAGRGNANLPLPLAFKIYRVFLALGFLVSIPLAFWALFGWDWLSLGFTNTVVAIASGAITLALAVAAAAFHSRFIASLFNIRRSLSDGKWVFGGLTGMGSPFGGVCIAILVWLSGGTSVLKILHDCPLPERFEKVKIEVPTLQPREKLVPVYFWDYATAISPEWLDEMNLLLPYEKGPPQKLLSKIYFENARTGAIELELHGKRPRTYPNVEVRLLFENGALNPADWHLAWKLMREAGLTVVKTKTLSLIELERKELRLTTHAIGSPWTPEIAEAKHENSEIGGRVFFWSPEGAVFQARCVAPCRASRMLDLVQFPSDARGSLPARIKWTQDRLKELLNTPPGTDPKVRRNHENLLTLYLLSLITLDPRDPETFFHLGKLARNRETVLSALRYGRDLGLDGARAIELQAVAEREFKRPGQ